MERDAGRRQARGERAALGEVEQARRDEGHLDRRPGPERLVGEVEPLADDHALAIPEVPVGPEGPEALRDRVGARDHGR